jgi:hypothetical protein
LGVEDSLLIGPSWRGVELTLINPSWGEGDRVGAELIFGKSMDDGVKHIFKTHS